MVMRYTFVLLCVGKIHTFISEYKYGFIIRIRDQIKPYRNEISMSIEIPAIYVFFAWVDFHFK